MLKPLLLLSTLILSGFGLLPKPNPTAFPQDAPPAPAATTMANPVKVTPEGMARAKKQYGYDCEMCHGATGDGKTDLAKDMKLTLVDLSDPKSLADVQDGAIFDLIKNGKDKMPGEGDRAKPDEIWNLVHYVRGLSQTK